jgi:hypothetical protein
LTNQTKFKGKDGITKIVKTGYLVNFYFNDVLDAVEYYKENCVVDSNFNIRKIGFDYILQVSKKNIK